MKTILTTTLLLATTTMTACSGAFYAPYDNVGRISLQADEKGMQAFSDMMNGLINETKTPKGQKSSYYQLRERQDDTRGLPWRVKMQERFSQGGQHE